MGNGQIQSFVPATRMISPFAINKIRGNNYTYGFSGAVNRWIASEGTDTKTNGASVTTWKDIISNRIFTRTNGTITYVSSDGNFNNKPTINFSTAAGRMTLDIAVGVPLNFTLLVIYKINTIGTQANDLFPAANTNTNPMFRLNVSGASLGEQITDSGATVLSATANDTTPHVSVLTNSDIRRDGVSVASGGNLKACNSIIQIGNSSNANYGLISNIAEIILFNSKLSTVDMDQLRDNARQTYGL